MRDPNRIEPMLEALREYWLQNPDLRLGQIVSNMSRSCGYSDPFFVEDRPMMDALKERTKKGARKETGEDLAEIAKTLVAASENCKNCKLLCSDYSGNFLCKTNTSNYCTREYREAMRKILSELQEEKRNDKTD